MSGLKYCGLGKQPSVRIAVSLHRRRDGSLAQTLPVLRIFSGLHAKILAPLNLPFYDYTGVTNRRIRDEKTTLFQRRISYFDNPLFLKPPGVRRASTAARFAGYDGRQLSSAGSSEAY